MLKNSSHFLVKISSSTDINNRIVESLRSIGLTWYHEKIMKRQTTVERSVTGHTLGHTLALGLALGLALALA